MNSLHPAIATFLGMDDRKLIVVCIEIKEQLGLSKRRLRVGELREAYEALFADEVAEDTVEDSVEDVLDDFDN